MPERHGPRRAGLGDRGFRRSAARASTGHRDGSLGSSGAEGASAIAAGRGSAGLGSATPMGCRGEGGGPDGSRGHRLRGRVVQRLTAQPIWAGAYRRVGVPVVGSVGRLRHHGDSASTEKIAVANHRLQAPRLALGLASGQSGRWTTGRVPDHHASMVLRGIGRAAAVLSLACGAVACMGDDGQATPSTSTSDASASGSTSTIMALGDAKDSGVEGLPVPNVASRDEQADPCEGRAGCDAEVWVVPPGTSMRAVQRWYADHLDPAAPWKDWTSCIPAADGDDNPDQVVLQWHRGDEALVLVVEQGEGEEARSIRLRHEATESPCN